MATVRAAVALTAGAIAFAGLVVVPGRAPVAGAIVTAILLLVAWRIWSAGIRTERGGVRIVGLLATRRVAWDDVDHFAVLPFGPSPWVGHVVLRDGRRLPCLAIAAAACLSSERRRHQVQGPIDALDAQLAKARERHKLSTSSLAADV